MSYYDELMNSYSAIKDRIPFRPKLALVLGSGLGGFAEEIEVVSRISYRDIPDFPVSTVKGHAGEYIFGRLGDAEIVCMNGRVHCYEGYTSKQVVMPIRLMGLMGAEVLFLTNAAGGLQQGMKAGDFMLIRDHISFLASNPLIGPNIDELGLRFPDMSQIYDGKLSDIIIKAAADNGISIREGVYCQDTGPSFETPAEIRMLGTLGVGAVGMSTAVEAIAARHMGLKVCGISLISNLAAGISENPLSHEEVQEAADIAAPLFKKLVKESIIRIVR